MGQLVGVVSWSGWSGGLGGPGGPGSPGRQCGPGGQGRQKNLSGKGGTPPPPLLGPVGGGKWGECLYTPNSPSRVMYLPRKYALNALDLPFL